MTDYRNLSEREKAKVDKTIAKEIEPGPRVNKNNGFEWHEPEYTLDKVHKGIDCAYCWCIYYNCLCSHDN